MSKQQISIDVEKLISEFENNLSLLNEKCIEFSQDYENYIQIAQYDGTILRNRMKATVIQAVPNDI